MKPTAINTKITIHTAMMTSAAVIFFTIAGGIMDPSQQAEAAAIAPPTTTATTSTSTSVEEDPIVMNTFVSPDGQSVISEWASRSPEYCSRLFLQRKGKSYKQQYRFWTQCILGRYMTQD